MQICILTLTYVFLYILYIHNVCIINALKINFKLLFINYQYKNFIVIEINKMITILRMEYYIKCLHHNTIM